MENLFYFQVQVDFMNGLGKKENSRATTDPAAFIKGAVADTICIK